MSTIFSSATDLHTVIIERHIQWCVNKLSDLADTNGFKLSSSQTVCVHFVGFTKHIRILRSLWTHHPFLLLKKPNFFESYLTASCCLRLSRPHKVFESFKRKREFALKYDYRKCGFFKVLT